MTDIDLRNAPDLPRWMVTLRERYLHTDTCAYILHGNVHDLLFCNDRLYAMSEFLEAFFSLSGKTVIYYDPGKGLEIRDVNHAYDAAKVLCKGDVGLMQRVFPRGEQTPKNMVKDNMERELAGLRDPDASLELAEQLLLDPQLTCALVLQYADLIAPDGATSSLNFMERTAMARLHRWSLSREIVGSGNLILLLTSSLSDLSRLLVRNPRMMSLEVPLPDEQRRRKFVRHLLPDAADVTIDQLARITGGLQIRQIEDTIVPSMRNTKMGDRSFFTGISARKKEILEQECVGLLEVIEPNHGFEAVGGMETVKQALLKVCAHLKAGNTEQVPMGILLVGPMGTGKTFVAEAFAKECGLAAVKLKNFRDKWVGSTEANLEKILSVIDGLGEIIVIIDEGDRSLGGGDNDSGVQSRVMARLKDFMSDTSHRGRIVFVMMTNRPDKLDTDMKRPGRFDLKIPFFHPGNAAERLAMLHSVLRRHRIVAKLPEAEALALMEPLDGYAAADLEAVALLAKDVADERMLSTPKVPGLLEDLEDEEPTIEISDLKQAVDDFMPTRELEMIEYMELLAVHEASNRRLLPEKFRNIQVDELNRRLRAARAQIPN